MGYIRKVEDVKSTQEPRYCVLRDIKEDLTSLLFPGLGKAESQYMANGQLSSNGNFKPFNGGREPELPFQTHSLFVLLRVLAW